MVVLNAPFVATQLLFDSVGCRIEGAVDVLALAMGLQGDALVDVHRTVDAEQMRLPGNGDGGLDGTAEIFVDDALQTLFDVRAQGGPYADLSSRNIDLHVVGQSLMNKVTGRGSPPLAGGLWCDGGPQ